MLVQRSNERGYLVGSRVSLTSFVAIMIGITATFSHYVCGQCQYSEFITMVLGGSGFGMPNKDCPKCGHKLAKMDRILRDLPWSFDGDKVLILT